MNNDQLWQAALGEIELSLSKANFTTWFKNTFISSFEDGQVVVCVPNTFTKTWLENKYHQNIVEALKNVTDKEIKKIFYKVEVRKNNPVSELLKKMKIKKESEVSEIEGVATNKKGLNYKYVFENYIVGAGNELAHAAAQAVSANPGNAYNPLFIYGGVGLGKTHLIQAIGHELLKKDKKVLYVTSEAFTNEYIQAIKRGAADEFVKKYRTVDLLLVDDVQFMGGKDGTQDAFFHTFNELHQNNKQIVLTSDKHPKSIPALEKRLASRFQWGMIADVTQPDIETRVAILKTKCRERNYSLDEKVLNFIASSIQSNIRELEGALNRLIVFHEFNNTTPTVESAREVLKNIILNTKTKTTTGKNIIEAVASFFDISVSDIHGKSRKKELVYPRQLTMYLMREEIGASYPTIGQELGGRDHTTAMHAFNKIKKEIKESDKIKQDVESIKQVLYTEN